MQDDGEGSVMLRLCVGQGGHMLARITRRSAVLLHLAVGMRVHAQVKGAALLRG